MVVDPREVVEVAADDSRGPRHAEDVEPRVLRRPVVDQEALLDRPRRLDVLLDPLLVEEVRVDPRVFERQAGAVAGGSGEQHVVLGVLVVGEVGVDVENAEHPVLRPDRHAQDRRQFERRDAVARVDGALSPRGLVEHVLAIAQDASGDALADGDLVQARRARDPVTNGVDIAALGAGSEAVIAVGEEHRSALRPHRAHRGLENAVDELALVEARRQRVHQRVGGLEQLLGSRRRRRLLLAARGVDDGLEKHRSVERLLLLLRADFEAQGGGADGNVVAVGELAARDGPSVDQGAVAAAQIPAQPGAVLPADLQVLSRSRRVPDHQAAAAAATDGQTNADRRPPAFGSVIGDDKRLLHRCPRSGSPLC